MPSTRVAIDFLLKIYLKIHSSLSPNQLKPIFLYGKYFALDDNATGIAIANND